MEKSLPVTNNAAMRPLEPKKRPAFSRIFCSIALSVIIICGLYRNWSSAQSLDLSEYREYVKGSCGQPDPLFPTVDGDGKLEEMWKHLNSTDFEQASIKRLSGAVQIRTESFDDLGAIGEDSRWDVMYPFAEYLEKTFPRVHSEMAPEKVNTHGLVYTLEGSDKALKPLLLMAHQDVVPVPDETVSAWTHPPFSGYYDGKYVWGRGSSDCKNNLISLMETMELFLAAGYKPKRTVVLSFGFDEEISGRQGAGHLSQHLLKRYGENGVAAIIDEGSTYEQAWGSVFAKPGTAEKGYTDVHITVRYPGGHSSVPSDHTSIGILSELITLIEAKQYQMHLADNNPYLEQLQCGAAYSPDFPKSLDKLLGKRKSKGLDFVPDHESTCSAKQDSLAHEAAKLGGPPIKYLMQTSQAVDIIRGGVKNNALPERVTTTVNHRINVGEKPELVWERLTKLAESVAEKYNISLNAFNGVEEAPMSISLWPETTTLNPAPVTPTDTDRNTPYAIVAGTTRAAFGEHIVVAPGIMTGNTDTR